MRELGLSKQSSAVVAAILALARSLNLQVVAEGVEDVRQMHALQQLGCGLMQGFLFSRAQSPGDIERWLLDTVATGKAPWIAQAAEFEPATLPLRARRKRPVNPTA